MTMLSQGPAARVVAQALSLTFLWSVVLMGIPLGPAQAQISTRTATTESVVVVPFDNLTRFRPDTLGKEASEAVAAELRDRLSLDVLPAADVELQMRELGLSLPLTDAELIRLATELEVTMVVTGQVRSAELVRDREGVRGEVVLAVRVFDRITEDSVNGALVDVKGPAGGPDTTEDTLMSKALQEAAFEALQEMRTRPSVVATVLWCREDNVYISVGARAGLGTGMQLAAIRDGKRIGTVQVTSADSLGSYGQRVSGAVLRPGDQLRGIYKLPSGRVETNPERAYRKKTRLEKMVIGAAALMGIAEIGSASRLLAEGGFAVPGFTVSNLANLREVVMSQELPMDSQLGGSLITWSPFSEPTANTRLLGFEIWRGFSETVSLVTVIPVGTLGQNWFIDLPWPYGIFFSYVTFVIDPVTGIPTFDPIVGIEAIDPDNPEAMLEVDRVSETEIDYVSWWLIGPLPGVTYQYRVRPIISERVWVSQGVYNWRINRETEYSTAPQQLTSVGLPVPGPVVTAGTTAAFYFYSPPGADEGILEIARDPNNDFPPSKIYTQTIAGLPATSGAWTLQFFSVDLTNVLSLPGSGDVYWWRVGCRNRYDGTLPRPWPLTRSNDYGYVWSSTEHLVLPPFASRMVRQQQERQRALLSGMALGRSRILQHRPAPDRRVRAQ
jgi:TolB-like protein